MASVQSLDSITNQLINESLCRLLLVDSGGSLTHQEWTSVIHSLIINIITKLLEVVLDWDNTLGGQLLNLLCAVILPVADVVVVTDAHWATSEDDGADIVVKARGADSLLVILGSTSLLGENEAGSDPDGGGAEGKGGSDSLSIVDTSSGNNLDWLASHWGLVALDELDDGWDQDGRWGVTSVSTSLTSLGADEIDTELEALLDVLWVADHVHVQDAVGVELVNDCLWWDTDGGDEELGAGFDDDVDELAELTLGVIVAVKILSALVLVFRVIARCGSVSNVLGLAGRASNLWEKEIDTEWSILIVQERLELGDLLAEHVWGVSNTTEDTETTGIGDGSSELWASGDVHTSQHNWVVDLQEISGGGAELLYVHVSQPVRVKEKGSHQGVSDGAEVRDNNATYVETPFLKGVYRDATKKGIMKLFQRSQEMAEMM